MIRGKKAMVTAVRRPNGEIVSKVKPLSSLYTGWVRRTPFLRGIIVLLEALVLGIQSLIYSTNVALEEEIKEEINSGYIFLLILVSLSFSMLLFFFTPLFLTNWLGGSIESSVLFHVIEGIIRLIIFLIYLKAISMMGDIKRVFAYHGAEHSTINAFEAGVELTPQKVKESSIAHARCGTSFLLTVFLIAIIIFSIFGKQELLLMVLSRIFLLPFIAAISYEITQYSARHSGNVIVKIIMAPGLWLQTLTTRKPDERQLEVAIVSLNKVLELDNEEAASEEALPA
jgi:uncharacterized protein YqhQ